MRKRNLFSGFFCLNCPDICPDKGCTNLQTDVDNCGQCGITCPPNYHCQAGQCNFPLYFPLGIQENVADHQLLGWTQCINEPYGTHRTGAELLQACTGSKILVGCKRNGDVNWRIVAAGDRSDVFFDTGANTDEVHEANNVNFYYHDNWSFGFAPADATVSKTPCDTTSDQYNDLRLCWHTYNIVGGYRCGSATDQDGDELIRGMWFAN